jgi:single-strand DNA-binding protein
MNEITTTITGNLTADPELRYTSTGVAVANFSIASTPRSYDRASDQWRDGEPFYLRCTIWRQAAENLAESLRRGDRVIVTGRLKQRAFETREGDKRTVVELDAYDVGASLQFRQLTLTAPSRTRAEAPTEDTADDQPPF